MKKRSSKMSLATLQAQMRSQAPAGWDNATSKAPLAFMDKTPRAKSTEIRKKSEHDSQAEIVRYLRQVCPSVLIASSVVGELWPMSQHVPKGIFYGWMQKLKNRGLLTGDPDLRLTWFPSRCVFLEKKRAHGGATSDAQEAVHSVLRAQGFAVYVMPGGIEEMREIILKEGMPCLTANQPQIPLPIHE